MRTHFILIIFLTLSATLTQTQNDIELDTIYLIKTNSEINNNKKTKALKSRGKIGSTLSSQFDSTLLTKVKNLKCLKLKSFSINFNEVSSTEDDKFEFLLYTPNKLGKPDKKINETTYLFEINSKTIHIDLSDIKYSFCTDFFIGIKKTELIKNTSKYRFVMRRNKNNNLFFEKEDGTWFEIPEIDFDYILHYELE